MESYENSPERTNIRLRWVNVILQGHEYVSVPLLQVSFRFYELYVFLLRQFHFPFYPKQPFLIFFYFFYCKNIYTFWVRTD